MAGFSAGSLGGGGGVHDKWVRRMSNVSPNPGSDAFGAVNKNYGSF